MILGKQRWWWVALLACVVLVVGGAASFHWIIGWADSASRYYFYLERGVIHGNNSRPPGMTPPVRPWYGSFEVFRSGVYSPWEPLPEFWSDGAGTWAFGFPLHLMLIVPLVFVVYPILPPVIRRKRRKLGLCVNCGYNLTGNVSGVCPECGEPVEGLADDQARERR